MIDGSSTDQFDESFLLNLDQEQLRTLIRASHEFNSTLDMEALLPRILGFVAQSVDAEACAFWTDEEGGLFCIHAVGPAADQLAGIELPSGAGLVGHAITTRTAVRLDDAWDDPRFIRQIDEATGYRTASLLVIPLVTRGEVVGALEVTNPRSGQPFGEDQERFLMALADDAAAAIRNSRLFEAEKRARDLKALLEVSHELVSTFDTERILLSIVNLAGRAVHFDRCILAVEGRDGLEVSAISGESKVDRKAVAIREVERLMLWATERAEQVFVADVEDGNDEEVQAVQKRFPQYLEDSGARSFLIRQVADAEGMLGAILFEFGTPDALGEWEREAIQLLEDEAALALRNAQLYAGVPFISFLEPLAQRRKALAALPGAVWIRYGAIALAAMLVLAFVRLPVRVAAPEAYTRAAVQLPVRTSVEGVIDAVLVREGERVEAGAPLVRLRNEELLQRLRESRAELERSGREALAANARGDGRSAALARVRTAEHTDVTALLLARMDQTVVTAPVGGIVLTPRMDERLGAHLAAGDQVAWIGDPDWIEVELAIRQADIGLVQVGSSVRARASAHPTVTFRGEVGSIAPRAERLGEEPVYVVRALLDNREGLLRPGMDVRARVLTEPRPLGEVIFRRPWRWIRFLIWW